MTTKRTSGMLIRNCQFAFKCDAVWENLEQKRSKKIRFCNACEKNVYLCDGDYELAEKIRQNKCVAIDRYGERLLGAALHPVDFER
ncbi:hypothetical protein [Novosphingobium sp. PASSN1]|uniref:hypothetical protein n=1 Tax=Novosphingobium sp. PASSN1 TaxID=2015561 RepID=UPI000BD343F8|nr:hypothetical protein [Novosphingobium sp. PASSN1]OYU33614.1 MAG: hypothetical protein CFE35_18805 [Novosphingobium sp. PASSN1]